MADHHNYNTTLRVKEDMFGAHNYFIFCNCSEFRIIGDGLTSNLEGTIINIFCKLNENYQSEIILRCHKHNQQIQLFKLLINF